MHYMQFMMSSMGAYNENCEPAYNQHTRYKGKKKRNETLMTVMTKEKKSEKKLTL